MTCPFPPIGKAVSFLEFISAFQQPSIISKQHLNTLIEVSNKLITAYQAHACHPSVMGFGLEAIQALVLVHFILLNIVRLMIRSAPLSVQIPTVVFIDHRAEG